MIELYLGSMKSGKTLVLNELIYRSKLKKEKIKVFCPSNCFKESKKVVSRNGTYSEAISTSDFNFLKDCIKLAKEGNLDKIYIDEVQFLINVDNFNTDTIFNYTDYLDLVDCYINLIKTLDSLNVDIICSGLDSDFKNETFDIVNKLCGIADKVEKLKGVCDKCGKDARRTYREVNNVPSKKDDSVIILEGEEVKYYCLCKDCYNAIYN